MISLLLYSDIPVEYVGRFYRLNNAILLPRPQRRGGPPILIGGNGEKRTLPLVARLADEWNAVYVTAAEFARLNVRLDELLQAEGREQGEVRRSLMTGCVFGRDQAEINRKVAER
ncbi:MAG: Luciferase-like monooxygenase, partial [Chloroflexi bacterium]|nr:Luciferase-like monooxygenase [Chloroflexota bacterium]